MFAVFCEAAVNLAVDLHLACWCCNDDNLPLSYHYITWCSHHYGNLVLLGIIEWSDHRRSTSPAMWGNLKSLVWSPVAANTDRNWMHVLELATVVAAYDCTPLQCWAVCVICSSENIVRCRSQMSSLCCVQHWRHSDIPSASEPPHHNYSYGDSAMGPCWSRRHICMAKWIHSRHFDCQQLDPRARSWTKQCPLHWLWPPALSHRPGKRLNLALLVLLFDFYASFRFGYSLDISW